MVLFATSIGTGHRTNRRANATYQTYRPSMRREITRQLENLQSFEIVWNTEVIVYIGR